jgi:hypothetical protein
MKRLSLTILSTVTIGTVLVLGLEAASIYFHFELGAAATKVVLSLYAAVALISWKLFGNRAK